MIDCIIVDDEQYSIDVLKTHMGRDGDFRLLETYTNPVEAARAINAGLSPQLIFLDIDMPDISGLEFAHLLPPKIALIYITAYSDYAFRVFETNVYDFLLKPISFQKFLKSAQKIRTMITSSKTKAANQTKDYIFINPGAKGRMIKLVFKDITHIEGLKNYIIIYTFSGKYITYLTMQEIEKSFPSDQFLRIHKSFIVNINFIQSINGNEIVLSESMKLPVGGNYKDEVHDLINRHALISKRKDH